MDITLLMMHNGKTGTEAFVVKSLTGGVVSEFVQLAEAPEEIQATAAYMAQQAGNVPLGFITLELHDDDRTE